MTSCTFFFFLSEYFYIRISKMPKLEYPKELEVALMYFVGHIF